MSKCFFHGCRNQTLPNTWKCQYHIHRHRCSIPECRNQVYARSLCVRHGGKKTCQYDGCTLNCRVGDYCTKHGPPEVIPQCTEVGCTNQVHLRGKCFRHGGSRRCSVQGCKTFARNKGFCARHTPKGNETQIPANENSNAAQDVETSTAAQGIEKSNATRDVEDLLTFYYKGLEEREREIQQGNSNEQISLPSRFPSS